jgi:hypothetical protein
MADNSQEGGGDASQPRPETKKSETANIELHHFSGALASEEYFDEPDTNRLQISSTDMSTTGTMSV